MVVMVVIKVVVVNLVNEDQSWLEGGGKHGKRGEKIKREKEEFKLDFTALALANC